MNRCKIKPPIAGHVNLCPSGVSTAAHDQEVLMSTVKHEILHALGFSAGLYAFFRDDNGQPRTKRNQYNKPVSLNKERGFYDWDESTIRSVVRENWWTKNGPVPHRLQMMITPRVRAEAVRHFGCSELEGVELENQGGDGTALTHWEKRLLENEAMTGTHTQNPAYSRITFALMEDSGWYQANYDIAEPLSWGQGLGCDFAKRSCGDWMQLRKSRGLTPAPFCETVKHDGVESRATTTCTDMRDSLALCNLVPYNQPLQADYLNYVHLNGIDDKEVDRYGGSVELADFCAYNQEFEWKSAMGGASGRRDSRCEIETNTPTDDSNAALETYGNRSRCFGHSGKWTQRKCGRMRTFAQYGAGCYEYICLDGRLYLDVLNGTDVYPCYHAGQRIAIRRVLNGWLHEGTVVCPACSELCQPNPGFAGCDPETTPPRPVGDPVLPEPCSAPSRYISLILLLSAIVLNAPFSSLFQCS
uniref:Leishmanolysin-like peptidase n=1 Tax=Plectus sambesii TaxID=2011161 RepID=A0A914WX98_9BILA